MDFFFLMIGTFSHDGLKSTPAGTEKQRVLCCENIYVFYSKEILVSDSTMFTVITENKRHINS